MFEGPDGILNFGSAICFAAEDQHKLKFPGVNVEATLKGKFSGKHGIYSFC